MTINLKLLIAAERSLQFTPLIECLITSIAQPRTAKSADDHFNGEKSGKTFGMMFFTAQNAAAKTRIRRIRYPHRKRDEMPIIQGKSNAVTRVTQSE
jgi:hypothetical protein